MSSAPQTMLVLSAVAALAGPACSDCDDQHQNPSYRIAVVDAANGATICDAIVIVNGTPARKSAADCTWIGDIPSSPDATIMVHRDGYEVGTVTVPTSYEQDSCGEAKNVAVEVELRRAS